MFGKLMKVIIKHYYMSGDSESNIMHHDRHHEEHATCCSSEAPKSKTTIGDSRPVLSLIDDEGGMVIRHGELELIQSHREQPPEGSYSM